jgi:hypothetical protein
MNLFISNIRKSIKILSEGVPEVPKEFIEVRDERSDCDKSSLFPGDKIGQSSLDILPWFYKDTANQFQSLQEPFFALYGLRAITRGLFIGFRFIQAGNLLYNHHFLAASISCYYSAAFQLLHSYLALNGRIIIDQVNGPPLIIKRKSSVEYSYRSLDPKPEVIIAILTNSNKWKFESRPRSHSRRWAELKPILEHNQKNTPDFFLKFFKYILSYGGDLISNLDNLVSEGLNHLTQVRHESIYSGYGYDDFVHDRLMNRDLYSDRGIDLKANAYQELAIGLLSVAIEGFFSSIDSIPNEQFSKVKCWISASTYAPPFEVEDFQLLDHPELSMKIENIFTFLFK